jgi:hypothetical protein
VIPILLGWRVVDKGNALLLVHPMGSEIAALRYCERVGPPRRIGVLVRELVAKLPDLRRHAGGDVERFMTDDGEHGATISILAVDSRGALHVHVAYVFTDDFYSVLVGTCRERVEEVRQLVRELAQQDNHALGVRRRRFQYAPPPGWQPLRRGLSTSWIPPDYPNVDTRLLVYPANPVSVVGRLAFGGAHLHLEDSGWEVVDTTAPRAGTSRRGLAYEAQDLVCRRSGATRIERIVVARDSIYQYPLEMWTASRTDDDRATLGAVIDSIIPLAPSIITSPALVEHWAD